MDRLTPALLVGLLLLAGCVGGTSSPGDPPGVSNATPTGAVSKTPSETRSVTAAGPPTEGKRYNVGVCPSHKEAGIAVAKAYAESVRKVIDFDELGAVVNGRFNETARETLREHPYIKYVEPDRRVSLYETGTNSPHTTVSGGNGCQTQVTPTSTTTP